MVRERKLDPRRGLKRKLAVPWTRPDGLEVLSLESLDRADPCRAVYLSNCTPTAFLQELVQPTMFRAQNSDYYIVRDNLDDLPAATYSYAGKEYTVSPDRKVVYLGSEVCAECFVVGQLVPQHGCQTHNERKCGHKRIPQDSLCSQCIPWTFAGFWQDRVECFTVAANGKQPWQVAKNCQSKFKFQCKDCPHEFEKVLSSVSSGCTWCRYCSHSKWQPCAKAGPTRGICSFCFDRSLASSLSEEKLACWSASNEQKPWQVTKGSESKFKFKCNACPHEFETSLASISRIGTWCGYCSNSTWKPCAKAGPTRDLCAFCFDMSLASALNDAKLACWSPSNKQKPWQVAKNSGSKFKFNCKDCPHEFEVVLYSVSSGGKWCRYCNSTTWQPCAKAGPTRDMCSFCFDRSLARSLSEAKLACWSDSNEKKPWQVAKNSGSKFKFKCDVCSHEFEAALNHLSSGAWCGYCNHSTWRPCANAGPTRDKCTFCFDRSLASSLSEEKLACWSASNEKKPWQVAKKSHSKFKFHCNVCVHEFATVASSISIGRWCGFCNHKTWQPCANAGPTRNMCIFCFDRSLASELNEEKLACWSDSNEKKPWQVAKKSESKFKFKCNVCPHVFEAALSGVSCGTWCRYCSHSSWQPCTKAGATRDMCSFCFDRSLASELSEEKLACWSASNDKKPWQVAKNCNSKFKFKCGVCPHEFAAIVANISRRGNWCPYCSNHRRCFDTVEECSWCDRACEVRSQCDPTKPRKARTKTKMTQRWVCTACLADVVQRDPAETPLQSRAKISLEIYTLAELQRYALQGRIDSHFLWAEPTAWDCAILPGLAYKPDNIWCFDACGNVFASAGACKLNASEIAYVLVLEVLEHGVQQHSDARGVADKVREQEIRSQVFEGIPVGFVYVVVAHTQHVGAAAEDVFFEKPPGSLEYRILESRSAAWQARVERVAEVLSALYEERRDGTEVLGK